VFPMMVGSALWLGVSATSCLDDAERAQELRASGQLVEARRLLLACAKEACPRVVKNDCRGWLTQVEKELPSLVVRVTLGDADVADASVFLDDVRVASDGRAIDVDPGRHVVRVERPGALTRETTVVAAVGEQRRAIVVRLDPAPTRGASPPPPPPPPRPAPFGAPVVVAAGVGVAGAVVFGVLQGLARADLTDLREGCGRTRTCSPDERSEVSSKFVASGVALGVAALGLGVAATLYLLGRPRADVVRAASGSWTF